MAWTFDLGEDARLSASTARDLLDKLLAKVRFELGALPYEWAFDKKPVWDDTTIYIELFGVPVAESEVRVHYDWTRSRDPSAQ